MHVVEKLTKFKLAINKLKHKYRNNNYYWSTYYGVSSRRNWNIVTKSNIAFLQVGCAIPILSTMGWCTRTYWKWRFCVMIAIIWRLNNLFKLLNRRSTSSLGLLLGNAEYVHISKWVHINFYMWFFFWVRIRKLGISEEISKCVLSAAITCSEQCSAIFCNYARDQRLGIKFATYPIFYCYNRYYSYEQNITLRIIFYFNLNI